MSGTVVFATLLILGAAAWFVLNRFGTPKSRAALDRLTGGSKLPGQDRLAQVGEGVPEQGLFGQLVMPLTIGVRGIATVLVIALLIALNIHSDSPESFIPPEYFWQGYMLTSALVAWYMGYVWTYVLTLDDARLVVPTWGFGAREYDLRQLIRVEDDNALLLRLYFEDGGKAEVFKNVRGRSELMAALARFNSQEYA